MTFLELARNRRSVRKFKDEPVEAELLKQVLEAARAAPTAANMQPVRLIVVQSSEAKEKLSHAANCYAHRYQSSSARIAPTRGSGRSTEKSQPTSTLQF